jgi:SAM-dependent methyltransferase
MQDLSRFQRPRFARMYERMSVEAERHGTALQRGRLLAGLSGRVIEVGAGNGMNFPHYPVEVSEVVAVEPEDRLRALAERDAAGAPVPVTVVPGHGGSLEFADGSFDAAVLSLVLCSVPDQPAALAEVRRVLRPDRAVVGAGRRGLPAQSGHRRRHRGRRLRHRGAGPVPLQARPGISHPDPHPGPRPRVTAYRAGACGHGFGEVTTGQ